MSGLGWQITDIFHRGDEERLKLQELVTQIRVVVNWKFCKDTGELIIDCGKLNLNVITNYEYLNAVGGLLSLLKRSSDSHSLPLRTLIIDKETRPMNLQ